MSKKVFAFDMDGTLLTSQDKVHPATPAALEQAKEKGHINVLCSGRPYFDMIGVAEELGSFDYMICNNGSYFFDLKTKKFHISKHVPTQVALDFLEIAREQQALFAVHTTEGVYRAKMWEKEPMWAAGEIKAEWHKFELIDPTLLPEIINRETVTQASIRATKEMVNALMKYAAKYQDEADVHIAGEVYLDINPNNTSKLTGINDLAKHINMSAEDFVTFGDSGNDLQMLRGAGLGIAMGNATHEAKEAADEVIGDNNSDAIAKKIIELI